LSNLVYAALMSLDGYIEDETGNFDWAMPDEELHSFINDLEQPIGTHLYGRRMYETMAVWQTIDGPDVSTVEAEFATGWRAVDKVVYSRTLDAVSTPRTRLEREFEPGAVQQMKDTAGRDISIGGPGLAQHAFEAGLVDEVHLFTFPIIIGGGKPALPHGVRLELQLLNERQFPKGVIYSHYRRR
jgi:dihydrofolate reductase